MFKKGEFVVYRTEVCKVKDIMLDHINGKDYYKLSPIDDDSLTINIPVENNLVRSLITKEKVDLIIEMIPSVKQISFDNEKMFEQEYKKILYSGKYEDLIKIIKTTFSRNSNRLSNKKKISEKDDYYFKQAEKMLYSEFAAVLNMSVDEAREYVISKVEGSKNEEEC